MKLVIQRVSGAELRTDGKLISEIGPGLCVYTAVGRGDTREQADWLAKKTAGLRIFEKNGKMGASALDRGFEVMVISQFTLYADTSHGNRPGFSGAEDPAAAEELYEYFIKKLSEQGLTVKKGIFGADMKISQLNDGPVTIIMER